MQLKSLLSRQAGTLMLACIGLLAMPLARAAGAPVDANAPPAQFVSVVANNTLQALQADGLNGQNNVQKIGQIVNQIILPYVDFEKTTRLATGFKWRQATAQQRHDLADAFRGTLIRTYSGALTRATQSTKITVLPVNVAANATDVVVRSTVSQDNGQPTELDYRLEKTAQGWRIYDLSVEGIWLIQNYRNQFAQEINTSGIDGLIKALQQQNAQQQ